MVELAGPLIAKARRYTALVMVMVVMMMRTWLRRSW
jgi:hypothetical protein